MKLLRSQSGVTLIEIAVSLAISGIILAPLVAIVAFQVRVPVKVRSELEAHHQVVQAMLVISEDARVARTFTSSTDPQYGTFTWFELSTGSPIPTSARYFWDTGAVFRELVRGGETSSPQVVLEGIAAYADVTFAHVEPVWTYAVSTRTWSYSEGTVDVTVLATFESAAGLQDTVVTSTLAIGLRPQIDLPAPTPGRPPPVAPLANQVDFRVAGEPTLITGVVLSGAGADLRFNDENFYSVRSTGSPRTVLWEVTSEVIDYTTTTDISIEFTAQDSVGTGVTQEIFVYNPTDPAHTDSGFDTSPDSAVTFTAGDVDRTVIFELSEDDVVYIQGLSIKTIKVRVKASHTGPYFHKGDQLIFRVAGTPAATFCRDFLLVTDPTIEVGGYVSGGFNSLSADDSDFYVVGDVGNTVQWDAVGEPINLDTISSVEVFFTAQVNRKNVVQEIFVFNPANGGDGYGATPDSSFTYTSTGTDATVSFFLTAADRSYVNSLFPKEVRIRVKGTKSGQNWQLSGDKLAFRAKP